MTMYKLRNIVWFTSQFTSYSLDTNRACPVAMGWSAECQARRWREYSVQEWHDWCHTLSESGYGRLDKRGWEMWIRTMQDQEHADNDGDNASARAKPKANAAANKAAATKPASRKKAKAAAA